MGHITQELCLGLICLSGTLKSLLKLFFPFLQYVSLFLDLLCLSCKSLGRCGSCAKFIIRNQSRRSVGFIRFAILVVFCRVSYTERYSVTCKRYYCLQFLFTLVQGFMPLTEHTGIVFGYYPSFYRRLGVVLQYRRKTQISHTAKTRTHRMIRDSIFP